MIYMLNGTPGSGKSLHLASDLLHYLNSRKNRLVICNFDIDLSKVKHPERFNYIDNSILQYPDRIFELVQEFKLSNEIRERSCILVLDECQILFNSRRWNEKGRTEWNRFFSLHRKLGFDVYLVCQFDEMIDKQLRNLVEYQVIHRKITNFGLIGGLLRLITWKDVFVAVTYWYGIKEKISQEFFIARKKYYSIYDTFELFNFSDQKENT